MTRRQLKGRLGLATSLIVMLCGAQAAAQAQTHRDDQGCAYKPGSEQLEQVMTRQRFTPAGQYDGPRMVLRDGRLLTAQEAGYTYAGGRPWHESDSPITFQGRRYVKPRPDEKFPQFVAGLGEMRVIGEYDGVAILEMDPGSWQAEKAAPGTIYVLHGHLRCEFEPYVPAG